MDLKDKYLGSVLDNIKLERPIRLAIDCGNGAAGVIAEQVYKVFKSDKGLLFELLNSLFSIAYADGELHSKEKMMLLEIAKTFKISSNEFESLNNIFEANLLTCHN